MGGSRRCSRTRVRHWCHFWQWHQSRASFQGTPVRTYQIAVKNYKIAYTIGRESFMPPKRERNSNDEQRTETTVQLLQCENNATQCSSAASARLELFLSSSSRSSALVVRCVQPLTQTYSRQLRSQWCAHWAGSRPRSCSREAETASASATRNSEFASCFHCLYLVCMPMLTYCLSSVALVQHSARSH